MRGILDRLKFRHTTVISLLLLSLFFFLSSGQLYAQDKGKSSNKPFNHKKRGQGSKQDLDRNKAGKKKKRKKSKTARKEKKGSNKPFNHVPRNKASKQVSDKNNVGESKSKRVLPSTKQDSFKPKSHTKSKKASTRGDNFSPKSSDRKKQPTTKSDDYSMKSSDKKRQPTTKGDSFSPKSKDRKKQPTTKGDDFAVKSKDRKKQPSTKGDDFAVKSKDRFKKPSTTQNKDGVGMVKKPRSEKNKQPINLEKTTVKVPVVNYRKTDLHRIRKQDKLKTAVMPARQNKAPLEQTYMVKVRRTHGDKGLPDRNPVEWSLKRSDAKNKNMRPEISKYHGDYKKPTRLYQEFLNWKKSRELMNHFGKLNIAKPANNRKEYRKLGRKISSWQGDIRVMRRHKHEHPSLRFQVMKQKPKGADVRRNNKKLKKAKYDPNEKKIWEPKDEFSTY